MSGEGLPVRVKRTSARLGQTIPLPGYQSAGAAGLDLVACLPEPLTLVPGARALVPTGIAIQLPSAAWVGLVFARSGLAARHGIHMANGVGVIDADYRGEILCPLVNGGDAAFVVQPGDRIAQLVFVPIGRAQIEWVEALDETERGMGGFGSTGVGGR